MNVLIAGGSGLLGTSITQMLQEKGFEVSHLSRNKNQKGNLKSFYWNPDEKSFDPMAFQNQDIIINLAGANIGESFWTKKRKKIILDSRVLSTKLLVNQIKNSKGNKPLKFISASACGYYGSRPGEIIKESTSAGKGFLSEVCTKWETETLQLKETGISTSIVRVGVVMAKGKGFLQQMEKMIHSRINIIPGDGTQKISWIHLEDLTRIFFHLITNEKCEGIYNGVGGSCSISYLQENLFRVMKKKFVKIIIPSFLLAKLLGNFSELFLSDQNIVSERLNELGLQIKYRDIDSVLENLYGT